MECSESMILRIVHEEPKSSLVYIRHTASHSRRYQLLFKDWLEQPICYADILNVLIEV